MKDIARELNLSPSTISRALSNPELVTPEKRRLIEEVIERLNYRPNLAARNLRKRSSRLVLVIFPQLSPFFLDVFSGIERAADEFGYTALMGHSGKDMQREADFLEQVLRRHADGAILVTTSNGSAISQRPRNLPPLVAMLEAIEGAACPTARVDNAAAAREATRFLIELGHRRIAHVTGPLPMAMAQSRLAGFREAIAQGGLDPKHCYVVQGDFSIASGEAAAERLLTRHPRPTAIFAANDEMAVGVLQTLKREGVGIGPEMSVIGFDDQRIARLYEPGLTTVHVPMADLGYQAMQLLRSAIEGDDVTDRDIVLPTSLVERATCAPPGEADRP
jgi:LacI family repressor for deo operon, udp, cdd, tsx, nupC, and nupG